jgi:NitT/TauT family transport system ATP-binding protein
MPAKGATHSIAATATTAVRLEGVAKRFGSVEALAGVSLRAVPGEVVAVVGPSGCGKTTLLELVCGLLAPDAGAVAADRAVLMPQRDLLLPWASALDNAALALRVTGASKRAAREQAAPVFAEFGLAGFEHARPDELSGGMRQRVSICRALIHNPPQLLMDEPFGALDALTRDQLVLDIQRIWNESRMTVLFITHSVPEAVFLSDRVIVMTPRPGQVDQIIDIDLPRPRTLAMRETPEFSKYSRQILDLLLARGVLRET